MDHMTKDCSPLLKMQQATVIKGGKPILDKITLEIWEGEHTAILGPNGAGKSSLIKLITRQDYPLASPDGTPPLQIFGQSLWNVFELRSQLGIVSADLQQSYICGSLPGRTRGLDVVLSGFFASYGLFQHHHISGEMKGKAWQALILMEAAPLAERLIEEMSTGEARRIMIARALVHDPTALLLDEPTTGLDLLARYRFLLTLQTVARQGKTIILTTHHIDEIFPEIQRVILIRQGRLIFDGPKPEAFTPAQLSALYGAPIKVKETNGYYTAACDY